jgi:hypothetical protein
MAARGAFTRDDTSQLLWLAYIHVAIRGAFAPSDRTPETSKETVIPRLAPEVANDRVSPHKRRRHLAGKPIQFGFADHF